MSTSSSNGRYQGASFRLDVPTGASGGTPVSQPSAPTPAPQPAPSGDPFQEQPRQRSEPKKHPILKVVLIIALLVGVVLFGFKGVPAIVSYFSNMGDSNPASSQTGNPGGDQTNDSTNSQTPDGSQQPDTDDGSQGTATRTVAEQAAALDSWFSGIPEENWITKTSADLDGSATGPLGQFGQVLAVVLKDGTTILHSTDENDKKVPIIVSDYQAPTEWYGMAIVLDVTQPNQAMAVVQITDDDYATRIFRGGLWLWEAGTGYTYQGNATSAPSGN